MDTNSFDDITRHCMDIDFWKKIQPRLSITQGKGLYPSSYQRQNFHQDLWNLCKETLKVDGYFLYERFFDSEFINLLGNSLLHLHHRKIPNVFCFVYDEFWLLLDHMRALLSDLLGNDFVVMPAVWAWVITGGSAGFKPHRDQNVKGFIDEEGMPNYLTLWVPLSDLNHLNSNIFVLPASRDPFYNKPIHDIAISPQNMRCLQAKKGSILAWTIGLVHWGSQTSSLGTPRLSLGYYVQKAGLKPLVSPVLDLTKPFSLTDRLAVIGYQIKLYERNLTDDLRALSEKLQTYSSLQFSYS